MILCAVLMGLAGHAQEQSSTSAERILLTDMKVQVEATEALNDMYNFKFKKAQQEFRWLKQKYGWHPLPYFLLGLCEWWKIVPNIHNTAHDARFMAYMDSTILIAKRLYNVENHKVEASFFLAAAYGFKGRLYSDDERKNWRKAASAGKSALNYLEESKGKHDLSAELLFGDGLYNYFSVWIPENYPLLKPILLFFPKGDKRLGIKQLKEVSNNAFYTRIEAQVFLMRILNSYEKDKKGAFRISQYLHQTFPGNPYFHRYYARMLYSMGWSNKAKEVSLDLLDKIDGGATGYEATSGRYAGFILGQVCERQNELDEAKKYYARAIDFSESIGATDTGYYLYSLLYYGDITEKQGDRALAKTYYRKVKENSKRSHPANKKARKRLSRKGRRKG